MDKALFLDRDGIINIDNAYVHKPEDFIFVDGIFELCQFFSQQGYQLFIITNQAGIGRGYYTEDDFKALMTWVSAEFLKHNLIIKKSYYCPHHPTAGIGDYKKDCLCRKPNTGMLLQAADEFKIDLSQSILIGDKTGDIEAGINAGLKKSYLIRSKYQPEYDFHSLTDMIKKFKNNTL